MSVCRRTTKTVLPRASCRFLSAPGCQLFLPWLTTQTGILQSLPLKLPITRGSLFHWLQWVLACYLNLHWIINKSNKHCDSVCFSLEEVVCSQRVKSCMYYVYIITVPWSFPCDFCGHFTCPWCGRTLISGVLPGNYENLFFFLMFGMWEGIEGEVLFVTCTFTGKLTCYQRKPMWHLKSDLEKI